MTDHAKIDNLIETYISECRRVNGDTYADMIRLTYQAYGGWFYLRLPWRTGNSTYTVGGRPKCLRRKSLIQMIETLRERPEKETPNAQA